MKQSTSPFLQQKHLFTIHKHAFQGIVKFRKTSSKHGYRPIVTKVPAKRTDIVWLTCEILLVKDNVGLAITLTRA